MPSARLVTHIEHGDPWLSVNGTITATIPIGDYVDMMVDHSDEGSFLWSEIFCQAEEGIRVDIMAEHRQPERFSLRISNEGVEEGYFDAYHLDPYYGATDVQVTFIRRGWIVD